MRKILYIIINVIVLTIATLLFFNNYSFDLSLFSINKKVVFLSFILIFAVHTLKAARLYLSLYGNKFDIKEYIKTYCKVIPVNIILPFKTGELFRIYCFGYLIKNNLKGIVVVLLDRFMDTTALITLILLICFFDKIHITFLIYILIIFSFILFLIYYLFPGFYKFWKHYFLSEKATKRKLWALKILEKINSVYIEITNIVKGRGIILYFLSLIAWVVELLNLVLILKINNLSNVNNKILEYLYCATGEKSSLEFNWFIFVSIIILISFYFIFQILKCINKKENR